MKRHKRYIYWFASLALTMTFSSISLPTYAQASDRHFIINTSLTKALWGNFQPQFIWGLTDYLALSVVATVGSPWILKTITEISKKRNVELTSEPLRVGGGIGALFMPWSNGINDNFHIEPRLSVIHEQSGMKEREFKWDVIVLSPTVNFGWHWIYESGFMMGFDFNAGWEFLINGELPDEMRNASAAQAFGLAPGGPSLGLDFRFGYAW